MTIDNKLLAASARQNPGTASTFDLGALLSPDNQFDTTVDGVTARCSDGVHMTVPGGELVAARLLPKLVALGPDPRPTTEQPVTPGAAGGGPALVVLGPALRDLSPAGRESGPGSQRIPTGAADQDVGVNRTSDMGW